MIEFGNLSRNWSTFGRIPQKPGVRNDIPQLIELFHLLSVTLLVNYGIPNNSTLSTFKNERTMSVIHFK